MPTDSTDDRLVAAVFRAALTLGIATPADLVPWADEQVLARLTPPIWIIDLCMAGNDPAERADLILRDPSDGADPAVVVRLLVGLVEGADAWTYEQARRADEWMWAAALNSGVEAIINEITAVDDGFAAKHYEGQGDPTALTAEIVAFVRKYADPAARAWLPGVRVQFGDVG